MALIHFPVEFLFRQETAERECSTSLRDYFVELNFASHQRESWHEYADAMLQTANASIIETKISNSLIVGPSHVCPSHGHIHWPWLHPISCGPIQLVGLSPKQHTELNNVCKHNLLGRCSRFEKCIHAFIIGVNSSRHSKIFSCNRFSNNVTFG